MWSRIACLLLTLNVHLWIPGLAIAQAIEEELQILRSEDVLERIAAAHSLSGEDPDPKTLSALVESLKDPAPAVRVAAALALGRVAEPRATAQAVSAVARTLDDPDREVLQATLRVLAKFGERAAIAAPRIRVLLSHGDPDIRFQTLLALTSMSRLAGPAAEGLVEALDDPAAKNRAQAAYSLFVLHARRKWPAGYSVVAAVAKLRELLRDKDRTVREQAANALGVTDKYASPALPRRIEALEDPEESVQIAAAKALGLIGSRTAVTALTNALQADSEKVRQAREMRSIESRTSGAEALAARIVLF